MQMRSANLRRSILVALCLTLPSWGQDAATDKPQRASFGVVVPPAGDKPSPSMQLESGDAVVDRIRSAQSATVLTQVDMVAEGSVTVYDVDGKSITFGLTIVRHARTEALGIRLRQSDGSVWNGRGAMPPGGGRALQFVDTQYRYGVHSLVAAADQGKPVRGDQFKESARILSIPHANGGNTHYFVDAATSRLNKVQYVGGVKADPQSGQSSLVMEDYIFTDYRTTQGVAAPQKVEHRTSGILRESLQLTSTTYHAVNNNVLQPGGTR